MDYYDSGTFDSRTGLYKDKDGYTVVQRGRALNFPYAPAAPQETESIITVDQIHSLNGGTLEIDAPLELKKPGTAGTMTLSESGTASTITTDNDLTITKTGQTNFQTITMDSGSTGLTANTKWYLKKSGQAAFAEVDADSAGVTMFARSSGANAHFTLVPKGVSMVNCSPYYMRRTSNAATTQVVTNGIFKVNFSFQADNNFPATLLDVTTDNTFTNNTAGTTLYLNVCASIFGVCDVNNSSMRMYIGFGDGGTTTTFWYGQTKYAKNVQAADTVAMTTSTIMRVSPGQSFSVFVFVAAADGQFTLGRAGGFNFDRENVIQIFTMH